MVLDPLNRTHHTSHTQHNDLPSSGIHKKNKISKFIKSIFRSITSGGDKEPKSLHFNNPERARAKQKDVRVYHDDQAKQRDGHMWACKDVKHLPSGGKEFTYQFDSFYKDGYIARKENEELFPAIEIDKISLDYILGSSKRKELIPVLEVLGYNFGTHENSSITVPDAELISRNYQEAVKKYNEIKQETSLNTNEPISSLNIKEVAGILPDEEYIKLSLENDLVISNENSFIHDSLSHVLPTILRIFEDSTEYNRIKTEMAQHVTPVVENCRKARTWIENNRDKLSEEEIQQYETSIAIVMKSMGVFIDNITSQPSNEKAAEYLNKFESLFINGQLLDPENGCEWCKMFHIQMGGDPKLDETSINEKWTPKVLRDAHTKIKELAEKA